MHVYIKMEMAPKRAVLAFILYKATVPINVNNTDKINAEETEVLPEGIGLFFVLSINASKSFSII